jgi:2-oxoisovalerate dehydrogenase E2 component (dihydrolipoyl transacylase)
MAPGAPRRHGPLASPAVRARAWALGVDLAQVPAGGTAGRIMQADLDAFVARGGGAQPPAPAPAARPAGAPAAVAPVAAGGAATQTIKVVGLRRKIAQKMQESKRRIPHFTYVEEVDVTELEALRAHLNAKWGESRGQLTPLPFIVRAIVLAVPEFPQVNARFDDEAGVITQHEAVHMGIATQTPAGLLVPVLRDAQALDLWTIGAEVARVSALARSGKSSRDELTGSTLTITSLGRLGGIVSTPVINHPEVAIVGVNRIAERPVIREGAVVARRLMNLSSSFDHRVVDGALAAEFVQRVRERLEQPALLFVQ